MRKKRILVAALNWGLGHATRCIPIIRELTLNGYEPIIASDGAPLELLKKEFPQLVHIELPSYNIKYPRKGAFFKWKMILDSPRIYNVIQEEKKRTKKLVKQYQLDGIISDNRLGVRSKKLKKNVFITHQLNVLSGNTTFLSSKLHQQYIRKFEECWVPDSDSEQNLSGFMGHLEPKPENVKYIGPLSRFTKREAPIVYDYLVLLSGPEPQRTILEEILLEKFKDATSKILFIRGVISEEALDMRHPHINAKNYLFGKWLEEAINCSRYVICRSGYSTIMDLAKLEKKAFFIPTPGQTEQEYLAKSLQEKKIAPYCTQEEFSIEKLDEIENYSGLGSLRSSFHIDFRKLFTFFDGK